MVSQERLNELKVILKQDYDLDLTDEEVSIVGNNLIEYFRAMYEVYTRYYEDVHKLEKEKALLKIRLRDRARRIKKKKSDSLNNGHSEKT